MRKALARGSLAALLTVLAIGVAPAGAQVQDPEAVLDHFLCYTGSSPPTPRTVFTRDQFGPEPLRIDQPSRLCVPSEKTEVGGV